MPLLFNRLKSKEPYQLLRAMSHNQCLPFTLIMRFMELVLTLMIIIALVVVAQEEMQDQLHPDVFHSQLALILEDQLEDPLISVEFMGSNLLLKEYLMRVASFPYQMAQLHKALLYLQLGHQPATLMMSRLVSRL